jgi:hypothetical protein
MKDRSTVVLLLLGSAIVGVIGAQSSNRTQVRGEAAHWSFQPVHLPAVPKVRDKFWIRSPVDAFILAGLEKRGLKPAEQADRRTLLRRVYLDLIGLPPTPEEMRTFLADRSPDAFRNVVDGLLARPQYGERWARHWLDVARFAESNGYERDENRAFAWRYRDYVIDAFNRDKPYDRFVQEQVAGDELPDSNAATQIATTFLRLGTWDDEPADEKMDRYDQLDDVLGTTASAFLGVTLRCARCHDHKFEPFTQQDYYRMLAVFEPLRRPQDGRTELYPLVGTDKELADYRKRVREIDGYITKYQGLLQRWDGEAFLRLAAALKEGRNIRLSEDVLSAFATKPERRTPAQREVVRKEHAVLATVSTSEQNAQRASWERQLAALRRLRACAPPRAYIWGEQSKVKPTHVLHRGDPTRPKAVVDPGLPEVLVHRQPGPPQPLEQTSGRRLWLARWLTDRDNPLTARVMVNRIWQWHFGEGIVPTANDLGVNGEAPSHPDLLDRLAAEFMASGWSVKHLHRLILLSNTYQMSDTFNQEAERVDPKGRLRWRWTQHRLEAEVVRDSVLAVSGRLNPEMGGPGVFPPLPQAVLQGQSRPGLGWGKSDERQASRRSVYIFVKRSLAVPELELLDSPDTTCSCEKRPVSTTAPQALTFLNGAFMRQQAAHFADRLRAEVGTAASEQVRRAFELALCRPAREEELRLSMDFLGRQPLEAFCLALLNTNEFAYVN